MSSNSRLKFKLYSTFFKTYILGEISTVLPIILNASKILVFKKIIKKLNFKILKLKNRLTYKYKHLDLHNLLD